MALSRGAALGSRIAACTLLALAAAASHAQGRYAISSDGQEVTDSTSHLTWRRCAEGMRWDGKTCSRQARQVHLRRREEGRRGGQGRRQGMAHPEPRGARRAVRQEREEEAEDRRPGVPEGVQRSVLGQPRGQRRRPQRLARQHGQRQGAREPRPVEVPAPSRPRRLVARAPAAA
jgi:Protein of unknown function (DUF1566).